MSMSSVALDDARLLEFYRKFQEARRALGEQYPLARYQDIERGHCSGDAMMVVLMAPEHISSAVNRVNRFCYDLHGISSWSKVFDGLTEDERYVAIYEFVFPLASGALGQPYAIKQMFIRSICEISHQTNLLSNKNWHEGLLKEKSLNFPDAQKQAAHFESWQAFAAAVSRLNNKSFVDASDDYRNRLNHGFPRRIEFGHMWTVTRKTDAGGRTYALADSPPLKIAELIPLLAEQHGVALECLNAYIELIKEQIKLWPKAR